MLSLLVQLSDLLSETLFVTLMRVQRLFKMQLQFSQLRLQDSHLVLQHMKTQTGQPSYKTARKGEQSQYAPVIFLPCPAPVCEVIPSAGGPYPFPLWPGPLAGMLASLWGQPSLPPSETKPDQNTLRGQNHSYVAQKKKLTWPLVLGQKEIGSTVRTCHLLSVIFILS